MDVPDLPANGVTQVQIIGDSVGPARHALCGTQRLSAGCGIASAPGGSDVARALVQRANPAAPRAPSRPKADPLTKLHQLWASSTKQNPDATASKAHRPSVQRAGRVKQAVTNMPNSNATVWPASVKPPPMVAVAKPSDTHQPIHAGRHRPGIAAVNAPSAARHRSSSRHR